MRKNQSTRLFDDRYTMSHIDRKLVACTWYVGLDDAMETQLRAALASNNEMPC